MPEYRSRAKEENTARVLIGLSPLTATQYMLGTDPTYDRETNKFCCTWCYLVGRKMKEQNWLVI